MQKTLKTSHIRKIKAHQKSHSGCTNCRLRKVKCNETRPSCKQCESYGTICNYRHEKQTLKRSGFEPLQTPLCSEHQTTIGVLGHRNGIVAKRAGVLAARELLPGPSIQDLEVVQRFHYRTLPTLGAARYKDTYQDAYARLTYSHSFLLHLVVTLTTMHDQYLRIGSEHTNAALIAYHWSEGASLLNERLSGNVVPSERDALWACAGLLGALSFASFHDKSVEETWPLKTASAEDLGWLRMSEGKREIRKIAQPDRADSIFHSMAADYKQYHASVSWNAPELHKLPPDLVQLCVDNQPTIENNPYLVSLSFLARTFAIRCRVENISIFVTFFSSMHPGLKHLIRQKDPAALLLLAYWYAKVSQSQLWWVWPRASMECQAICRYLSLHHGDNNHVAQAIPPALNMCII